MENEQEEQTLLIADDGCRLSQKNPTFTVSGERYKLTNDIDWIGSLIMDDYKAKILEKKKNINWYMKGLYNRVILFDEKDTTSMIISLRKLLDVTGQEKTCHIQDFINDYMGEKVNFFRDHQKKRVPVEMDRIANAYLAVKAGKPKEEIQNILYHE